MATAAELRIPVVVDGRQAVASFGQIQQAAAQARERVADEVAGSARVQATAGQAAAELERRRIALVLQGIEDTTERRVASINLTSALEQQAVQKLIDARVKAGEITLQQGVQLRDQFERIGEAARSAQIGGLERNLGAVAGRGRNASEAVVSLARGLEDASYAGGNFGQIVRYAGNNVAQFVTQLGYARAEAQAAGKSVAGSLVASLAGPAGLVLALAAAQVALPIVQRLVRGLGEDADESADRVDKLVGSITAVNRTPIRLTLDDTEARARIPVLEQQIREARQRLAASGSATSGQGVLGGSVGGQVQQSLGRVVQLTQEQRREEEARLATQESILEGLQEQVRQADALKGVQAELNRQGFVPQALIDEASLNAMRAGRERDLEEARRAYEERKEMAAGNAEALALVEAEYAERRREINERYDKQAQTAAARANRQRVRELTRAEREAAQVAREQGALRAQLYVDALADGFDREKEQLRQQRDERLAVARGDAALRLAVEAAYERGVEALRRRTARERVDRERANLAAVVEARESAYDELGRTEAEAAQATVDRVRAGAEASAALFAERAAVLGLTTVAEADLAEAIRTGTFAEAERLAVLAATNEELRPALDLLLERLSAEAALAGAVREQRIEREALARQDAADARERADRLGAAAATVRSGGRIALPEGGAEARAELERARAALADVDAALGRLAGTAGEVVVSESGAVDVVVEGQRVVGDEVERLAEERVQRAREVAAAEVAFAEASAEAVRQAYEDRLEAAEDYASAVLDAVEDELTRERRFSDLDVAVAEERFRAEELALQDSLDRRRISQAEYDRDVRALRSDRADFEAAVLDDERDVIGAFLAETLGLFREAAKAEIAAQLAPYVAKYFKAATEFFSFLGPFAPVAAAATVPAAVAVFNAVVPKFAAGGPVSGGPVSGPGGPTEDRVPALLSAGEHVLTAREVDALGGHDAVLRWRRLALAGALPRFAYGGPVLAVPTSVPVARPAALAAPASASGSAVDLSPLVAELRETRAQVALQAAEITRLAQPRVLTDPEARRAQRRARIEDRRKAPRS